MADKRLDQENVLTDFDYALIVKGTDVAKISKADLASVVGGQQDKKNKNWMQGAKNGNWIRVASATLECQSTAILSCTNSWNNAKPDSALIAISACAKSKSGATRLLRVSNTANDMFSKVRFVQLNGAVYIDVYVGYSSNNITLYFLANHGWKMESPEVISVQPAEAEEIVF